MNNKSAGIVFVVCLAVLGTVSVSFARDADLEQLPVYPGAQVVWQDKPIEVNDVQAQGTHLRAQAETGDILSFYQAYLEENKWEVRDLFKEQNVVVYIKGGKYVYIGVKENGPYAASDIYLIASKQDVAICRIMAAYMEQGVVSKDTPGRDISDVGRFPGSHRMLSIYTPADGAILLYQADRRPNEIARYFKQNLKANGWKLTHEIDPGWIKKWVRNLPGPVDLSVLVFEKQDSMLVMNVTPLQPGVDAKKSMITVTKNMLDEFAYPFGTKEE